MSLAHQPSMWDVAEEATLTPLTGRVTRHQLTRGAWVDHLPGWVEGSDHVLEVLLGDIGWRADRRPMYEREGGVPRLPPRYRRGRAPPRRRCGGGTGGGGPPPPPPPTDPRRDLNGYYGPELGEAFVTAGMC